MINVFKSGGDWLTNNGEKYTVKSINLSTLNDHLKDGWSKSLDEAISEKELTEQEKFIALFGDISDEKILEAAKEAGVEGEDIEDAKKKLVAAYDD